MLIEIHMLQTHSPSNVNRDDLGAPKAALFGNVPRARISSQCLKRSIRTAESFKEALPKNIGTRTVTFPDLVRQTLEDSSIPEKERQKFVEACTKVAQAEKGETAAAPAGEEEELPDDRPRTGQLIFVAPSEVAEFVRIAEDLRESKLKDYQDFLKNPQKSKAAKELRQAFQYDGVDIALFGRMTTSAYFQNIDASMQVAHALSTHAVTPQVDYYTAVDDLPAEGQTGSAFLAEAQFNSATYYKYFSLNYPGFLQNLGWSADQPEADRKEREALAAKAISAFIEAAATAVPSGKRNSFANNNLPDAVLIELKPRSIPTSYANAFVAPAAAYADSGVDYSIVQDSMRRMRTYAKAIATGYSLEAQRWWFSLVDTPPIPEDHDFTAEELPRVSSLQTGIEQLRNALEGSNL